jgi:hypothetical protein
MDVVALCRFDPETGDVKLHIDPVSALPSPYCRQVRYATTCWGCVLRLTIPLLFGPVHSYSDRCLHLKYSFTQLRQIEMLTVSPLTSSSTESHKT